MKKYDPNRKYKIAAIIVALLMIIGMILPYLAGAFNFG
jgi:hypothetical protein